MRFDELYVPPFTNTDKSTTIPKKSRKLRTDFGSSKLELICDRCEFQFAKRNGPNTPQHSCPSCGYTRFRLAPIELAKDHIKEMNLHIIEQNSNKIVTESLIVLNLLVGDVKPTATKYMKAALSALMSVDDRLAEHIQHINGLLSKGSGHQEIEQLSAIFEYNHDKDNTLNG